MVDNAMGRAACIGCYFDLGVHRFCGNRHAVLTEQTQGKDGYIFEHDYSSTTLLLQCTPALKNLLFCVTLGFLVPC